jgi:hypothetical protein
MTASFACDARTTTQLDQLRLSILHKPEPAGQATVCDPYRRVDVTPSGLALLAAVP